jgi:hypothetical protein
VSVNGANGSAALIFGMPVGNAKVAASFMQTSRLSQDRIVHLQISPAVPKGRVGVSLGVQDLTDDSVTTPDYRDSARSLYAAATYDAGKGVYVTAGMGTQRFGKGFVNASAPLFKGTRAMVEHDGFNWNAGLAVKFADLRGPAGQTAQATMFIGVIQGKYAVWSLGLAF